MTSSGSESKKSILDTDVGWYHLVVVILCYIWVCAAWDIQDESNTNNNIVKTFSFLGSHPSTSWKWAPFSFIPCLFPTSAQSSEKLVLGSIWDIELAENRNQSPYTRIHVFSDFITVRFYCFYRYHKCQWLPIREAVSTVHKSRCKLIQYTDKNNSS